MLLVHIWDEPGQGICVYTVHDGDMRWRIWLGTRDARKRKFHSLPPPGYWSMDYAEQGPLVEFFNSVGGWQIATQPPPHFYVRKQRQWFRPGPRSNGNTPTTLAEHDPYADLYLLPSAPKEIVDAAYRALMKMHHRDHGGTDEAAKQINIAKDAIYKERGW